MARRRNPRDVFLNCPFDDSFRVLRDALTFTVHDCGYRVRSALEVRDSGQVRIQKIRRIIASCRFGIHDISYTALDPATGLPRFNMPLELGMFLGAKWFGGDRHRGKQCLVLDRDKYRYQTFCSDIAGQDIEAHGGRVEQVIRAARNWLRNLDQRIRIPGPKTMIERHASFRLVLPVAAESLRLDPADLTWDDYTTLVARWLKANPW